MHQTIVAANNDTVTDLGLSGFGADTILFATNIGNQAGDDFAIPRTIFMAQGEFELTEEATIVGPGQGLLTINALQTSRIFNITSTTGSYTFSGLTLTGGLTQGDNDVNDFFDNTNDGGAIRSLSRSILTIDQSTISDNHTTGVRADGGGISAEGGVALTGSTVTGNSTSGSGGGMWIEDDDSITITNSIVAGNTADDGVNAIDSNLQSINANFSLFEQTGLPIVGSDNITRMSANLGPLSDNGGPTKTHALLPGSPAIDAGGTTTLLNDQRGAPFVRVFDDPMAAGSGLDMGAYERQTLPGSSLVVDTTVDENDGNYSAGDLSLREAIDLTGASIGADTITFDAGVFASPQTMLLELGEIELSEAVTIEGPGQALLTIDAQQQSRIFNITTFAGDFTFSGLTLTGGSPLSGRGGAIRSLTFDTLTIDQSTVSGNSTTGDQDDGGGVSSLGPILLTGSTVRGNSTAGHDSKGGGVFSLSGTITLIDSTVSGNSTTDTFARGGGIYTQGAVMLTDSTVSGNSTAGVGADGGGISSEGAVTLASSTVSGNFTTADSADGGGIFSLLDTVTLSASTLSGNSTAGNSADGGGIYSKGAVTLQHSTITDNHANHANAFGGGVWNDNDSIVIDHSIVAGNTDGGGLGDIRPGTGALTVDYSLIGTGVTPSGGDNNVPSNSPNLAPLTSNGGTTKTHAPLPDSLAIDAGDPSILFNPAEFDQRGSPFVRVFDGDAVGGARIDIGAFERQSVAGLNLVVDTVVDEVDGDYSAGNLSLREAVAIASFGAGTITFDDAVFATPQTILLSLGEIEINDAVTIEGPGGRLLTIDASASDATPGVADGMGSRVFNINDGNDGNLIDVTISGMTLSGGDVADKGGAIRSRENLSVIRSTLTGNSVVGGNAEGGGIYQTLGALHIERSTIARIRSRVEVPREEASLLVTAM